MDLSSLIAISQSGRASIDTCGRDVSNGGCRVRTSTLGDLRDCLPGDETPFVVVQFRD